MLLVTVKVAVLVPAATITEAGSVNVASLVEMSTVVSVTAALFNVTVHVLAAFGPRLAGVHASEDTVTLTRLMVSVAEVLL